MGAVYRARHPNLPIDVAVKVLRADTLGDQEAHARFRAEVLALSRVQHPNMIPVIDAGRAADGSPYYVMPLVVGRPLSQIIKEDGPLDPGLAASHAARIARAIHAVHTVAQTLHRDVKPSNVLIETATGEPKLFDFGLARPTVAPAQRLTVTGAIVGTPEYMAPEQAEGLSSSIDVRTDVYGLGALLYALLTGEAPIPGGGRALTAVLADVSLKDPIAPHVRRPEVPRDLSAVVLTALAKSRDRRYPSALLLAEDLERFGEGKPVLARPPGAGARLARVVRGNAPWIATIALLGAFVVAVTAWFVVRTRELERRADDARQAAEDARRRDAESARQLALATDKARREDEARRREEARRQDETRREEERRKPSPSAEPDPRDDAAFALEGARALDARGANAHVPGEPQELAAQLVRVLIDSGADFVAESTALEAATLLLRANAPAPAAQLLERAHGRFPASLAVVERWHFALVLSGQDCHALHDLTRKLVGRARNGSSLEVEAEELFAHGDRPGAYTLLEEANAAPAPRLVLVAFVREQLFLTASRWQSAAACADEVLGELPRESNTLAVRAHCRLMELEPERAFADLAALLPSNPDSFEMLVSACTAAEMKGDFEATLALAGRAEKLRHDSLALYFRGAALLGLGRKPEAKAAFEEAIRQDSFCARAHLGLCTIALDADDTGTARAEWALARQSFDHTFAQSDGSQHAYNQDAMNVLSFVRTLVHAGAAIEDRPFAQRCHDVATGLYSEGLPPKLSGLFANLGL